MTVGQITVGHVVNMASNDIRLIDDVMWNYTFYCYLLHFCSYNAQAFYGLATVLSYPLLLMFATAIMYYTVGMYAFLAIGVVVGFIPLQMLLTKVYNRLR